MHMAAAMLAMPDVTHIEFHACPSLVHRASHWWFLAEAMLGHMLSLQNALKCVLDLTLGRTSSAGQDMFKPHV